MKARRIPRKIGGDDEGDGAGTEPASAVKRPIAPAKANKPSLLKASFALRADPDEEAEPAIQKPLKRRPLAAPDALPIRSTSSDDRPSYSADYLQELRTSTPHAPAVAEPQVEDEHSAVDIESKFGSAAVDVESKFGSSALAVTDPYIPEAYIPGEAEIREKKERRRRLAKEQDFISLDARPTGGGDASDDELRHRSLIIPADEVDIKSKYAETRLVHEDEDIAEGFDDFVEDAGRVALGRKAAKKQERDRRKDLEEQIRAAQHGFGYNAGLSDEEDDEDGVDQEEAARIAAYEAAQTRAGIQGGGSRGERDREQAHRRRLELPKTKPVPELAQVVARFAASVQAKRGEIVDKRWRLERLAAERRQILQEEARVKALLAEAGQRFERLRSEAAGPGAGPETALSLPPVSAAGDDADTSGADDAPSDEPGSLDHDRADADALGDMANLAAQRGLGAGAGGGLGFAGGGDDADEDDYY